MTEVLQRLLKQVQGQLAQQARGQAEVGARQNFLQESRQLLLRAESMQAQLRCKEELADEASAQRLLRQHRALREEIRLQQERSGHGGAQGVLRAGPRERVAGSNAVVLRDWGILFSA